MRSEIALLLGVFALACVQVQAEKLIWAEEFDTLDQKRWNHLVTAWDGGNGEFQYYRNNRKNSFTRNGVLFIRPTPTADEIPDLERGRIAEPGCNFYPCVSTGGADIISPYFSARIFSNDSFSVQYGRIEFRVKMPLGDWMWPSIWMMPTDNKYGKWPKSGEIDLFEVRSNPDLRSRDGKNHGVIEVTSSIHYGPSRENKALITKYKQGKSWADTFHTYGLTWTRDLMNFTVDGQIINEIRIPDKGGLTALGRLNSTIYKGHSKDAPFDQRFHFIINVAVGGEFFPPHWTSSGRPRPWKNNADKDKRRQFWKSRNDWIKSWGPPDQHSMQVDYIRVYQ